MTGVSVRNLFFRSYSLPLKHVVLPVGDFLFSQKMMSRLKFLEQAQWWSRDQIFEYRDGLLIKTIKDAYEVPFYRELMDDRGIVPSDITSREDLHKLPIVSKAMLRAESGDKISRTTGQSRYDACSSGSTGEPFCVKEDNFTAGWYRASFMLALQWAGWRMGEPHLQTGMSLSRDRGRKFKDILLLCQYESAYDLTNQHLDMILDSLNHKNIDHLWGYPGSLYHIAKRALETGRTMPLKSIVTWGDMVFPHYRQTLKEAFQVYVSDTYGCAEGIQVSAQCEGSPYYLVHNLDVIVEYLDDDDQPAPPGKPGNLILTRLHAGPTPLLRYRVGDVAISGGDRKPLCGRGFEVMESIDGRDTDIVLTPSGNRLIVHFFTGILEYYGEIDAFQVVQETLDEIILRVVPNQKFNSSVAERMISELQAHGADLKISVEPVSEIPLTKGGKRRFVISKLSAIDKARIGVS